MKIIEFVYFNQSVVKSSYCPLWTINFVRFGSSYYAGQVKFWAMSH